MSLYSLLTVAGTASLAFGGNTKDRLSYSEDKHDYPSPSRNEWPSKKWASDKYDHDEQPSGHAYSSIGPKGYERTYGKAYSYDPRYDPYRQTYGYAHSMQKVDDDKHYDVDYHSSNGWKRPSSKDSSEWQKPSKHSRDWKKDGDDYEPTEKYGNAYSQRGYERTYGKAYSMHKDEEPKANWKKSDYPSRNWKKNDEPKGHNKHYTMKPTQKPYKKTDYPTHSTTTTHPTTTTAHPTTTTAHPTTSTAHPTTTTASAHVYPSKEPSMKWPTMKPVYEPKVHKDYAPKYEPKKPQWAKDDYEPKHGKKDYSSKDESKHDEPSEYEEPKEDDDDNYGTAYALGLGSGCTQRSQCSSGCCEGPFGQGRCVEKKIDWTKLFAYCPAECVGCFGCRAGTC